MTPEIYQALQNYLTRLGIDEYQAGIQSHIKSGKRRSTYRHNPSQYHRDLVKCLGRDDEVSFKILKREQGYSSVLGVCKNNRLVQASTKYRLVLTKR